MLRRPPTKIGRSLLRVAGVGVLTLLAVKPLSAATWYVDGASAACSNSGPGSSTQPFCAIKEAASKARPGDRVLVSPAIYRETVVPKRSGSPGSPITYQATGPRTIVLASVDMTRPDKWKRATHGAWRRSLSTAPKQVFVDGERLDLATSAETTTTNSFFYDPIAGYLYVNIGGGNPGLGHQVEVGSRLFGIDLAKRSYIVVDGFEVRNADLVGVKINAGSDLVVQNVSASFTGAYGIRVEATTGPILVEGCTASDSLSTGILVFGSTGVTLRGNRSNRNGFHGISLQSSSNILVEKNVTSSNDRKSIRSSAGIDVNAGSSSNSIIANTSYANQDSGIQVYNSANDNLVARNVCFSNGDHGFDTNSSTGTRYVNNTSCGNFKDGFSVEGGSTNTVLTNNIALDNGVTTGEFDLFVDPLSIMGFSSDYNIFYKSRGGRSIKVAGVIYDTLNDYRQATANEDHGVDRDPLFMSATSAGSSSGGTGSSSTAVMDLRLSSRSPAIDSANSGVSGFILRDRNDIAPVDDVETANNGSGPLRFVDRGAYEFDPAPMAELMAPSLVDVDVSVTADASGSTDNDAIEAYTFDFGDGTSVGPQAGATASHAYSIPGTYTVLVTVTDRGGKSSSASRSITIQDRPPFAELVVNPSYGSIDLPVIADASASSGTPHTPIQSYKFDFGDGVVVGPQAGASAHHVYTRPGAFDVVVTVTNAGSRSTTATYQVIVVDNPPIANLTVTPSLGVTNLTVTADASGSTNNDATPIATYTFNFGDGTLVGPQTSPIASHTYTTAGDFTVQVTVADTAGNRAFASAPVKAVVNGAPSASLNVTPSVGRKPVSVRADASASTDNDPAPIASFTFNFGDGTVVGPQAASSATHLYTKKGVYTVTVTVTDTAGLSSQTSKVVTIKKKGRR